MSDGGVLEGAVPATADVALGQAAQLDGTGGGGVDAALSVDVPGAGMSGTGPLSGDVTNVRNRALRSVTPGMNVVKRSPKITPPP